MSGVNLIGITTLPRQPMIDQYKKNHFLDDANVFSVTRIITRIS